MARPAAVVQLAEPEELEEGRRQSPRVRKKVYSTWKESWTWTWATATTRVPASSSELQKERWLR